MFISTYQHNHVSDIQIMQIMHVFFLTVREKTDLDVPLPLP